MTIYQAPGTPPVRPAAPVAGPPSTPVKRPVWPTAVGIISIVVGGLFIMCGACGVISSVLGRLMLGGISGLAQLSAPPPSIGPATTGAAATGAGPEEQMASLFEAMAPMYTLNAVTSLLSLAAAIILLIAGIKLLKRRRSARAMHFVYVAFQVVSVSITVVVTWYFMSTMADAFEALSAGDPAMPKQFGALLQMQMKAGAAGSIIWAVIWGLTYPVFLLIWFLLPKVRREIGTWGAAAQTAVQAP